MNSVKIENLEEEYQNFYAPAFVIEIENTDLLKLGAEIPGVSVDNVIDGADQFSFSVNNPFNPAKGEFEWIDKTPLELGKEVSIRMGYGSRLEELVLGIITSLRFSFPAGGSSQLDVSGYALSHLMMKGKKSPPSWNDSKDSDIVARIAKSYGYGISKIEDSIIQHPKIKQDNETDYDFVSRLAKRNGFEFFVRARDIYFRRPPTAADPELTLEWGRTMSSFSPDINVAEMVAGVRVVGWDPSSKKEIIGKAMKGQEEDKKQGAQSGSEVAQQVYRGEVIEEVRKPVYNQSEADRIAKALLNQLSEGLVKGSGECPGIPVLKPGITVKVSGLGRKFSRKYYVERTTHSIGTSGYKTTFNVRGDSL